MTASQRVEHGHLVLWAPSSGNAAGSPLPNSCVTGLERTIHHNQHSQHSANACQGRIKANTHEHHTLLLVWFWHQTGSWIPLGLFPFPIQRKHLKGPVLPPQRPQASATVLGFSIFLAFPTSKQLKSHDTGCMNFWSMFSLVQHWFC